MNLSSQFRWLSTWRAEAGKRHAYRHLCVMDDHLLADIGLTREDSILPHKRRSFWKWVFSDAPRRLHAQGNEQQAATIITNAIKVGGAPENTKQGEIQVMERLIYSLYAR